MFRKTVWIVSLAVLTVMFVGITGCTDSEGSAGSLFVESEGKSNSNIFGANNVVYDEDFSLTGKIARTNRKYVSNEYYFDEVETLKVSLPKDGGKYYRITVTTHDPESMVNLGAGCNYTYKCKKDKFSDYSVGSATRSSIHVNEYANKMRDINTTIYIIPTEDSYLANSVANEEGDGGYVKGELIDRSFYLILKPYITDVFSKDAYEVGEIVRANGRITVEEIDEEELGYLRPDSLG